MKSEVKAPLSGEDLGGTAKLLGRTKFVFPLNLIAFGRFPNRF
jgi:hypothetical protein